MAVTRNKIDRNLRIIRGNIAAAAARARRDEREVRILPVTKSVDEETIRNLLDVGQTEFGENRTSQLVERAGWMRQYLQRRRSELAGPVRWHMIGHLQRNKVKRVVEVAEVIHSVDSLRLAEEIQNRCQQLDRRVEVMMQVNCSFEDQKGGVALGAAAALGEMICTLDRLTLTGLMTMGPVSADPDATREAFIRLRELYEEMKRDGIGGEPFRELSMGMSQDYMIAVEQGATMLRIGSALFA